MLHKAPLLGYDKISRNHWLQTVAALLFMALWFPGLRILIRYGLGLLVSAEPELAGILTKPSGVPSPQLLVIIDLLEVGWTAMLAVVAYTAVGFHRAAGGSDRFAAACNLAGSKHRGLLWLTGLACGALAFSLLMVALIAAGVYRFDEASSQGAYATRPFAWLIVLYLIVGFTEEFVFRGYLLNLLSRAVGFWPAALVTAFLFGAIHLVSRFDSITGAAIALLFGIIAALSVRFTGTIWLAVGFHSGWDFFEAAVWGVPNGGVIMPGVLWHSIAVGPAWASGGGAGPEGGLPCGIVLLVLLAVVAWAHWSEGAPTRTPLQPTGGDA